MVKKKKIKSSEVRKHILAVKGIKKKKKSGY